MASRKCTFIFPVFAPWILLRTTCHTWWRIWLPENALLVCLHLWSSSELPVNGLVLHLGVSSDPGCTHAILKPGLEYSHGQQQSIEPSWRPVSPLVHELYPHICWLYSLFRCLDGLVMHLGVSSCPGCTHAILKPGLECSHDQQSIEPSWRPVSPAFHELYPHLCW